MTVVFFSEHAVENKVSMTDKKWEKLKCVNCGVLFDIVETTEYGELKVCPECGQKRKLIKKL